MLQRYPRLSFNFVDSSRLKVISSGTVEFSVVVEKDEDGNNVVPAPESSGCHAQRWTLDEIIKSTKEAIETCLLD